MIVLKKYGNRRLYDTSRSVFITLADVAEMVRRDEEIQVVDAKSGEDLTRVVLLQIIMEHQKHRIDLLPIQFLRQLVTYREDTLKEFFENYLTASLSAFASTEREMTRQWREGFEGWFSGMLGQTPWRGMAPARPAAPPPPPPQPAPPPPREKRKAKPEKPAKAEGGDALDALQKRLEELEKRLAANNKKPKKK
jgi:polyhydroxyalkanoate synthesis repressor PhaR